MSIPLPNPVSPAPGSFWRRLVETRKCLRALKGSQSAGVNEPDSWGVRPKVSVMLITYNHERYVRQALDSILMQKRDFEIEINVIDDASTDRTQDIVREYEKNNPGLINCYFNPVNAGHIATQLNTIRGFQTLRGEYFALLEGDDYWTDDKKLSTQVDFLRTNGKFVACAHQTMKVFDDGSRPPEHFLPFKAFGRNHATMYDLISMAGVFHLSSVLYRNVFGLNPPPSFADPYSCEVTINMTYGMFGDFFCLDQYMSAYRVHGDGVFSGRSLEKHWLFHLHGFRRFALYLGPSYWAMFARAISGFSRYVLSSPRREEVPSLAMTTYALFLLHLAVAIPVCLGTSAYRFSIKYISLAWVTACQKTNLRKRMRTVYHLLVKCLPISLIQLVLSMEAKLPRLRAARHHLKRFLER